jgi:glycosyltransferase involved in cell wall biosynthesis
MNVSVVIPTRNRSALLATTLRSVVRQQEVEFEIVVVDEASTDDTQSVIDAFGDPRIRVVHHDTPRGVATARNAGAAVARGEWLGFLDDDDLWAPDKLVRQLKAAIEAGRDWVYAGAVNLIDGFRIAHGQPPLPPDRVMAAIRRYDAVPGGGSNVIVRRATWLRAGPFDARLRNTEDWEMWIRLAALGPPAWVCSPLVARRLHSSNSSLDVDEIVRGTKLIEVLHDTRADWGRMHRWMAQSSLRNGQRRAALLHFARAAARGEIGGVASDFLGVARSWLPGRLRMAAAQPPAPPSSWHSEASGWLREFERSLAQADNASGSTRVPS